MAAKKKPTKPKAVPGGFQPGNPGGPGGARPGAGRKPQAAKELQETQLLTPLPDDAQLVKLTTKRAKGGGTIIERTEHPHPFAGRSLAEAAWATLWELMLTAEPEVRAKVALSLLDRTHGKPPQSIELTGDVFEKWYRDFPLDRV